MRHFIKITYNNYSSRKPDLKTGWGFSAWIYFNNKNILFDTGGDGKSLLFNLQELGLTPSTLDAIFISHNHNDHTGGLFSLISLVKPGTPVYIPEGMKQKMNELNPGFLLEEIFEPTEISDDIWSTGPVSGSFKGHKILEQALVLRDFNRIWIIMGCSHPGPGRMLNIINSVLPNCSIEIVAGGFHLKGHSNTEIIECSVSLTQAGVKEVAPSHCISDVGLNLFKDRWKDKCRELYLGDVYEIIKD